MARGRRSLGKSYTQIGRSMRIRLSQNPDRPFRVHQRSVVRKSELQKSPWWWITHRRGINRPRIGGDPLEMRAIPKGQVKGTLPERIVLKWLLDHYFVEGVDFDFQSSLLGGRLELGGIVADFLFHRQKIVLQVQGPTHDQYARMRKDDEQKSTLSSMGYTVHDIEMTIIYDEPRFEEYMLRLFNFGYPNWGGSVHGFYVVHDGTEEWEAEVNQLLLDAERVERLFIESNNRLVGIRLDL